MNNRLPLLFTLALALVIALAIAVFIPGNFLATPDPFEFPPPLYAAIIGAICSVLLVGLKDRFPKIAGALAVLISAVVTTILDFLAGVITTGLPPIFWPMLLQGCYILISWLATWGTYHALYRWLAPHSTAPPAHTGIPKAI